MNAVAPWKIVAGSSLFGAGLLVLGIFCGVLVTEARGSSAAAEPARLGAYAIAPSGRPGSVMVLDTETGELRMCEAISRSERVACGIWGGK